MSKKFFILYANCVITSGIKQSIILDLQRNKYYLLPKTIASFFDVPNKVISYNLKRNVELQKWVEFMKEKELGFWTSEPSTFKKISTIHNIAPLITNSIIDVSSNNILQLNNDFFFQLDELGCKALQLRIANSITIDQIIILLKNIKNVAISSLELFFSYSNNISQSKIKKLLNQFSRISLVVIHSAKKNELYLSDSKVSVYYTTEKIHDYKSNCGIVSISYFSCGTEHYIEAHNCNTCLKGKISIDERGEIKNCPSMQRSYGNIKTVTLESALNKKRFKELWNIKKDDIEVCKDCEYRYICTDCRAHISDCNNVYSKPSKCSYNPYLGLWEGEEGYIPT